MIGKSWCQAHTLLCTTVQQSRHICVNSPPLPAGQGPRTSLPLLRLQTQVLGIFLRKCRCAQPCQPVSFGFTKLYGVERLRLPQEAVRCHLPPLPVFRPGIQKPAFHVRGQGKNSHPCSSFWTCEEEKNLSQLFLSPKEWSGE